MALKFNILIIVIIVFLGTNVLSVLGINQNSLNAFILSFSIFPLLTYSPNLLKNKSLLALLVFVILYSIWMLIVDKGEGTRATVMAILGAPMLISALPLNRRGIKYRHFWRCIFIIVAVGFIVETSLSVFERIYGRNVFGWHGDIIFSIDEFGSIDYRSTALYGHPLSNALLVSTAMSFILISKFKPSIKYSLWLLGFASILCFNTRGSIVGNAIMLAVYLVYVLISERRMRDSTKISIIVSTIVIAIVGYISIFYFGLGGRLLNIGLFYDGSSQVRVNAWTLFDHYSIKDFLFLHSYKEKELILYSLNLHHLENPWLGILLRNGLIFLTIYVILFYHVIKRLLKEYSLFNKLFVTSTYFLLASTSNSFDTDFSSLYYFLLLCIIFTPKLFVRIVPSKYRL